MNEIEGSGVCTWYFMAGKTNVTGDVISRNPLDRDAVSDKLEAREGKPITLREAMRMVMSARGVPEEDLDVMLAAPKDEKDPEVVKFMTDLEEGHSRSNEEDVQPRMSVMMRKAEPVELMDIMDALYMPNAEHEMDLEDSTILEFSDGGSSTLVRPVTNMRPTSLQGEFRRWFSVYGKFNRGAEKTVTLQMLDNILELLRELRFIRVRAVIAHGEAAFVIMGMMSPMLRHKAYVARRVTAEVQEVFEETLRRVELVVLLSPQGVPLVKQWEHFRSTMTE